MSITIVTPENADHLGRFTIVTRDLGADGTTSVHRRPIEPGRWVVGEWVPTDVSEEGPVVQAFVSATWTPEVVAAFKRIFPWTPPVEPTPAPLTTISKDAIWRRATDAEAELMEAALQSQPVRLRRIYEGATHIETTDELYGVLEAALVQLFGAERAAELLEPTG